MATKLKVTMPTLVDAAGGKKSRLLVTTVGRENMFYMFNKAFPSKILLP